MPSSAAYYWIVAVIGFVMVVFAIFAVDIVASLTYGVWQMLKDSMHTAGMSVDNRVVQNAENLFDWALTGVKFSLIIVLVGLVIYVIVNSGRKEQIERFLYGE